MNGFNTYQEFSFEGNPIDSVHQIRWSQGFLPLLTENSEFRSRLVGVFHCSDRC